MWRFPTTVSGIYRAFHVNVFQQYPGSIHCSMFPSSEDLFRLTRLPRSFFRNIDATTYRTREDEPFVNTPQRAPARQDRSRDASHHIQDGRQRGRRRKTDEQTRDLLDVIEQGAVIRRHQFFSDFRLLIVPAVLAGLMQCVIYSAVILRTNRSDWYNLALVCIMVLLVPVAAAIIIASVRTREFPFSLSALASFIVYNIGVVILSAMRIPISYTGLLWAAPVAVMAMTLAAARLTRANKDRLAILDFPGARKAAELIGGNIAIVDKKAAYDGDFDCILIDGTAHHTPDWNRYLTRTHMRGTRILPWFAALEERRGRVNLEHFDITHLAYSPSQIYYTRIKRLLDLFLVAVSLPVTVPLGALVWLYIRMIDGGPCLFVQTRRGYAGKNFRMLKFRTMRRGSHGGATGIDDDRILLGCRLLRRTRIDELPQIVNIIRGEMSWIGPRPVSLEIAQRCERMTPAYAGRYLVLPGITGWAQIQYGYAGTAEQELEKLGYDLYYLKRISFDLDLEITLRTIRTLVTGKGGR